MKSGKKKLEVLLSSKFHGEDYKCHHASSDCNGAWGVMIRENISIPIDVLGAVTVPLAFFMVCEKCHVAYFVPGFEEMVERSIAAGLVISDRMLLPKEIRFLRVLFGLTQKELCTAIDMDSDSFYSKCEQGKPNFVLSSDKQVRLKLFYAVKLGIDRAEDYNKISLTTQDRAVTEPAAVLEISNSLNKDEFTKWQADHQASLIQDECREA